jgi:hypothetical protein
MKMVELQFAIFSLRIKGHTEMNWASPTNFARTIQGIIPQFVVAAGIFAIEPHAARMSSNRAAEDYSAGSQEAVRNAREIFAHATQDARVRDDAVIVPGFEGDACFLSVREAHND